MVWQCCNIFHNRGEQEHLLYISICYNLFTAGGLSLQGSFHAQVVIIKKRENVEAYRLKDFDDG